MLNKGRLYFDIIIEIDLNGMNKMLGKCLAFWSQRPRFLLQATKITRTFNVKHAGK